MHMLICFCFFVCFVLYRKEFYQLAWFRSTDFCYRTGASKGSAKQPRRSLSENGSGWVCKEALR